MEEWLPTLQRLIAAGLALLLVMLRLEAERFSAAEYDEATDGRPASFRRRIAWYLLRLRLIFGNIYIPPGFVRGSCIFGGRRNPALNNRFTGFLHCGDPGNGASPLPKIA